ncbi:MAG TPA: hypothetical protein PK691_00170 [Thermomicrobiales bacterium]|nr:hypothetical protein [Thermomicrobiales bacterium]HRA47332.1 hypothetical protein [Thermomicrobiales bacterium]
MHSERANGFASGSTVIGPGKREVDLYIRTYTTLLQSSGAIGISSLEPAHINVAASLHAGATEREPDMNAFMYSVQRLPASIVDVRLIVLGQQPTEFTNAGYTNLDTWQVESAPGRRRRWLFDGTETLAAYIASTSDLDDLIPTIVAYQIEWNKMHRLIAEDDRLEQLLDAAGMDGANLTLDQRNEVGERLLLSQPDWQRLQGVWAKLLWPNLGKIAAAKKKAELVMLGGSFVGYTRATRRWFAPVQRMLADLDLGNRPVYFVSSNMHSFTNVLSGTARRRTEALLNHIRTSGNVELSGELEKIESGETVSSLDNLLYFAARSYFAEPAQRDDRDQRTLEELERGIYHIDPQAGIDVGVQIIDLARMQPESFDARLCSQGEALDPSATDAIIVNVNYPLGFSAYHLLSQVAMSMDQIRGIYILGKAATLNGRIGDVMLANVVFDEHSGNTYWFDNCFTYGDLAPYLQFGAALDNQKAVTVKGTYLQNQGYLDFYYRENFTVVEMEAGPYLDAIYEDSRLERFPENEAINLRGAGGHDIDLGIIHYASDTPYTRAQTLGARGMSFYGMDSTYASTIAILRRVFTQTGILTKPDAG